jgi:16S rRNA (uracil1498-N3)-methyltransferase
MPLETTVATPTTGPMRTLMVGTRVVVGLMMISDDEAHHGRSVLRLRPGDALRVADGVGGAGFGTVSTVERHAILVQVERVEAVPACPAELLTVAVAPPKGDRLADLVRGLTELGVGCIRFLGCERGEGHPGRPERLERVAAEALKQCQRGRLPQLGPEVDIPGLAALGGRLIVLDRSGTAPDTGRPQSTTLVIGPEGGLTTGETAALRAAGAVNVRLAGPILRIETAALAASAVWATAWEHHHP